MPRVPKEVYEERLAETEQAIVRLRSSYRVETTLAKKYNVDARTVRKWMTEVRKRWKAAAIEVDRDAHRNELAATLNEVVFQAMNKSFIVKNADGSVVLDTNPASPTYGRPVVKANPDLQRVLHAVSQLRSLYGVDAPIKSHVTLAPDLDAMPDLSKLDKDGQDKLEAFLKSVAPGGDITALAGQWFTTETAPTEPAEDE